MALPLDVLLPFLVGSVLVTVIPGADMALVTRQVLVGGPALAQKTIFGNLTRLLVHGVALAAGLSALLVASAAAYTVVKLAGAAYTPVSSTAQRGSRRAARQGMARADHRRGADRVRAAGRGRAALRQRTSPQCSPARSCRFRRSPFV